MDGEGVSAAAVAPFLRRLRAVSSRDASRWVAYHASVQAWERLHPNFTYRERDAYVRQLTRKMGL